MSTTKTSAKSTSLMPIILPIVGAGAGLFLGYKFMAPRYTPAKPMIGIIGSAVVLGLVGLGVGILLDKSSSKSSSGTNKQSMTQPNSAGDYTETSTLTPSTGASGFEAMRRDLAGASRAIQAKNLTKSSNV